MKKQQAFSIKGMTKDISPSKSNNTYAYDIQNMRITAQEGETMLSLVNEKGNKEYSITLDDAEFTGTTIGYSTLDKYLVIFTHDSTDNIYRLEMSGENSMKGLLLYSGDLGFTSDKKLETLSVFESTDIQKVYWIDGEHQPRFINIAANEKTRNLWKKQPTPFDFISEYKTLADDAITVEKGDYSGAFQAGTVQYAFSYYNLNGQQTNIFYVSPILYTSNAERGASADETVSNSFVITIKDADYTFNYIRVYRIMRTTTDAQPECRIIQDIPISSEDNSTGPITIVDSGIWGTTVDPYEVLFAGGRDLIPETMAQKDGTLFMGNFKVKTNLFDKDTAAEIKQYFKDYSPYFLGQGVSKGSTGSVYMYNNQLKYNSQTITTFKGGDTYRFGLVFQDNKGEWSNVVYIGDKENSMYPNDMETEFQPVKAHFTIPADLVKKIQSLGYTKVKGVVSYPLFSDRKVVCQGVLSPTVYNVSDRKGNHPYAQSSWFFRDIHGNSDYSKSKHYQHRVQNSHNWNISTMETENGSTNFYDSEILGASTTDVNACTEAAESNAMDMFVDWNILTMNTPEFNYENLSIPSDNLKMRIVGVLPITSCYNDMSLNVSSAPMDTMTTNFRKQTFSYTNKNAFGDFMKLSDFDWYDSKFDNMSVDSNTLWSYPVFPWQRSKSLVTQYEVTENGAWYGEVNTKVIANLRTSSRTIFLDKFKSYDISNAGVYNGSNPLIKLSSDPNDLDYKNKEFNYYGDVDTILMDDNTSYGLYARTSENSSSLYTASTLVKDSVRMKYKSEPHIAFQLRYTDSNLQTILPSLTIGSTTIGKQTSSTGYPVWGDRSIAITSTSSSTTEVDPTNLLSVLKGARQITYYVDKTPDGRTVDWDLLSNWQKEGFFEGGLELGSDNWWATFRIDNGIVGTVGSGPVWPYGCYFNKQILSWLLGGKTPSIGDTILFPNIKQATYTAKYGESSGINDYDLCFPMLYRIVAKDDKIAADLSDHGYHWSTTDGDSQKVLNLYPYGDDNTKYDGLGYWYYNDEENSKVYVYEMDDVATCAKYGTIVVAEHYPPVHLENTLDTTSVDVTEETGLSYNQDNISLNGYNTYSTFGFLYLAELYRDKLSTSLFGGTTETALQGNIWNTAGKSVSLNADSNVTVPFTQGDTYFQRYDCLKTYPYTNDDPNQIVEIFSFMCETRRNIDGRYDTSRGMNNILNARLINFNLFNPVYTQNDNFFSHSYLDYNKNTVNVFPNTMVWTKTKTLGEDTDSWTNVLQPSSLDLDGDKGSLRALKNYNDNLLSFQDNGIAKILYNERVQVEASDGVSIEIANSGKVQGRKYVSDTVGCTNKWTIQATPKGLYFMDSNSKDIYILGEGISSLSKSKGFNSWLYNRDFSKYRTFYDEKLGDVYFTDNETSLVFSEQFGEFEGFYSYGGTDFMFNYGDEFVAIKNSENNKLWHQFAGDYNYFYGSDEIHYHPFSVTVIANEGLGDKIFGNVEFLADSWDKDNNILSSTFDGLAAWNEYQIGFNDLRTLNKNNKYHWSSLKRKFRIWRAEIPRAIYVSQALGIQALTSLVDEITANGGSTDSISSDYSFKKSIDRIRSTWAYIKLSMQKKNSNKTVLHNLFVDYYI